MEHRKTEQEIYIKKLNRFNVIIRYKQIPIYTRKKEIFLPQNRIQNNKSNFY